MLATVAGCDKPALVAAPQDNATAASKPAVPTSKPVKINDESDLLAYDFA